MYITSTREPRRAHLHATRRLACGHVQFVDVTATAASAPCEHCPAARRLPIPIRSARRVVHRVRRQPCAV